MAVQASEAQRDLGAKKGADVQGCRCQLLTDASAGMFAACVGSQSFVWGGADNQYEAWPCAFYANSMSKLTGDRTLLVLMPFT